MTGSVARVHKTGSYAFLTELEGTPTPAGGVFAHKNSFMEPALMTPGKRVSFQLIFLKTKGRYEAFDVTDAER